MKGLKSVHDVEAAVKAHKVLHKPNTVEALAFMWKSRLSEKGGYVVVTPKDRGQLGHFMKACPPGKAEKVLSFVLDDWVGFAKKVESMAGLKIVPTCPSPGFLLKHVDIAVKLASPPKPVAKQEATPALLIAQSVQLTSHGPEPEKQYPKSLAEIWADPTDDDEDE